MEGSILKATLLVTTHYTSQRCYGLRISLDWFHEEAKARKHAQSVHSGRGLRRALSIIFDNTTLWVVLIATGIGIGFVGGWLDILVAWYFKSLSFSHNKDLEQDRLSDIRIGRCDYNILYNQATCCKGYDRTTL